MIWYVSIQDRNGTVYPIDEPVGTDAIEITLKRDLEKHGAFTDFTANSFTFFEPQAVQLIQSEYLGYGVEGQMLLIISYDCGNNLIEELYRGRMDFSKYYPIYGDAFSISIPIEVTGDVLKLRNRLDQKVDLDKLFAFDGTTALPPYSGLGISVQLPSKGIFLQDKAVNETAVSEQFLGTTVKKPNLYPGGNNGPIGEFGQVSIPFAKNVAGEIGSFDPALSPVYTRIANVWGSDYVPYNSTNPPNLGTYPQVFFDANRILYQPFPGSQNSISWEWPLAANPILNNYAGSANYGTVDNPTQFNYRVKFNITAQNGYVGTIKLFILRLPDDKDGTQPGHYQNIAVNTLYGTDLATTNNLNVGLQPGQSLSFDVSDSLSLPINNGDRIIMYLSVYHWRTNAQIDSAINGATGTADAFKVEFGIETSFLITSLSHTPASPAKLYLLNECWSRVVEAITDGAMRAYSDYFGRTDSQPYASASDGCGSLQAVTNGIRIRRQENRNATAPIAFAASINDLFEGADPINHIGYGIEADPQRPGSKRLRIEPWKFFYDNMVVLTCNNVSEIEHTVVAAEHYSTASFGYDKWQTEELYNGLDDLFSKRQYRTTLSQVKGELTRVSKFVASPYAIEDTRRKASDSKDWRYDNETFVICIVRLSGIGLAVQWHTGSTGNNFTVYPTPSQDPLIPVLFVAGQQVTITNSTNNGIYDVTAVTSLGSGYGYLISTIQPTSGPIGGATFTPGNGTGAYYTVELGNITGDAGIIEPATLYNYRITPARNAMRWLDKLFASYRNTVGAKLLFMSGDGNYNAAGEQQSPMCKIENGVLSEKADLDATLFANAAKAAAILRPERDKFDYPMSFDAFKLLQLNLKGLIAYNNYCYSGQGWIDNVVYKPNEESATFTIIPKV